MQISMCKKVIYMELGLAVRSKQTNFGQSYKPGLDFLVFLKLISLRTINCLFLIIMMLHNSQIIIFFLVR